MVARRTKVIVDDVQDHAEAQRMSSVHEATEVIGLAVKPRRSERMNTIISPTEATGKFPHRHEFEN